MSGNPSARCAGMKDFYSAQRNMTMLICVLGRQPDLGAAELEALFGHDGARRVSRECMTIREGDAPALQRRLGGTIKIGEVVLTIPSSRMNRIYSATRGEIIRYVLEGPDAARRKVSIGISAYGMRVSPGQIYRLLFDIRRHLLEEGRQVRVVSGGETALGSAKIIHEGLVGGKGHEFLLVGAGRETYLARTVSIQDIEGYAKRDYGRPRRDTRTGMLPPKLAQMMLNLAGAGPGRTVVDPFCGTGVVLMEAALMRSRLAGGDIRQQMVDCTVENLQWLSREFGISADTRGIVRADATVHRWRQHLDCVVSETHLGRPLAYVPSEETLRASVIECDRLVARFLANLQPQLDAGSRCCIAVPAWNLPRGMVHLPVLHRLESMGYRCISFRNAGQGGLVYLRPGQIVARELLVLATDGNARRR